MRQAKFRISLWLMFFLFYSLHAQENVYLSTCKKIAEKKGELITCDVSKLKETIRIPLSAFTEDLQIVKLDNADEALVKESSVEISDNYILVKGSRQIPYKLFDRKTGKFLHNIGSFGQGPGEYQNVYDQQLDEENNRIYLLPWSAKRLLVYDLKGHFLESIPLCSEIPKGHFKVDTKAGTITLSALPFEGIVKAVVWQQTTKGELLKSIAPDHLSLKFDFSNEMEVYKAGNNYGFSIFTFFEHRPDSVYHYDTGQNKLVPVFTLAFKSNDIPMHYYKELPNYFMGEFAEIKKINSNNSGTQNQKYFVVEKSTLKGSYFTLENDFLGGIEIGWPIFTFSGDYYVRNVEPVVLKEELEKLLKSNRKITSEMKAKIIKLKDSITENDNNYILYAKMKK